MRTTPRRGRAGGFTLLEVMIAIAILASSLTWLIVGITRNIGAENHAKLMTTATFLARGRMIQIEDELRDKGFGEFEKTLTGDFEDRGFQRFTWRVTVDKVELPSVEQVQTMMTKSQDAKQAGAGPGQAGNPSVSKDTATTSNPMAMGAAAMSGQFGLIKDVLEQGIRRVTTEVLWKEGRSERKVEVVAYFTDPKRVDQAIMIGAGAGLPGAPTPSTSTTTGSSSSGSAASGTVKK